MKTLNLPADQFLIVMAVIVVFMIVLFVWDIIVHFVAFAAGCLFMFLVSTIRYKGQSLIGGTNVTNDSGN